MVVHNVFYSCPRHACHDDKMVKLNRKKITATTDKEVVSKHKNIEGESTEVLQKLIVEEANLIEEKEN